MSRTWLAVASFSGAVAVVLGALGAHALKQKISADQLLSFETAVKYQMYHSLLLLILAFFNRTPGYINALIMGGIILFSGSIYLLATREVTGLQVKFLGPVTPMGGLLLIAGWVSLGVNALRNNG